MVIKLLADLAKFILPIDRSIEWLSAFCLVTINQDKNQQWFLSPPNQANQSF
ncbi:hypothetical protein JYQ62_02830 [Nostoc sp. UHCC 0702]|nr:hypothetical protein JYQ62_02830 [Nostoc sp. UHCC 0702]